MTILILIAANVLTASLLALALVQMKEMRDRINDLSGSTDQVSDLIDDGDDWLRRLSAHIAQQNKTKLAADHLACGGGGTDPCSSGSVYGGGGAGSDYVFPFSGGGGGAGFIGGILVKDFPFGRSVDSNEGGSDESH